MNINQQSEVEDLFKRVNKDIHKNNKFAMEDTDLNKVRAYVVFCLEPAPHAGSSFVVERARRAGHRR